jgi:hypothetical protein
MGTEFQRLQNSFSTGFTEPAAQQRAFDDFNVGTPRVPVCGLPNRLVEFNAFRFDLFHTYAVIIYRAVSRLDDN